MQISWAQGGGAPSSHLKNLALGPHPKGKDPVMPCVCAHVPYKEVFLL